MKILKIWSDHLSPQYILQGEWKVVDIQHISGISGIFAVPSLLTFYIIKLYSTSFFDCR